MVVANFPHGVWLIAIGLAWQAICATGWGAESPQTDSAGAAPAEQLAPLLAERCLGCHNGSEKKGGLDLTRRATALTGGDSGPALSPGDVEASLLWQRIVADEMPPGKAEKLSADERERIRGWIAGGADWAADPLDPLRYSTSRRAGYDWWSLKPLVNPSPPNVQASEWPRSDLDRFVLARLEKDGLRPSAEADRRTLIRRLSYGLTGLPPTPQETLQFQLDPAPDAYDRLVDRLLESPRYGEHWARHWLDVARFGESQGFERDKLRQNSWPYRDWVIEAFNSDLRYPEFVRRQLAGDVLYPDDSSAIVATGFLVAAPWDEVGHTQQSAAMRAVVRQDELEDLVGTTAQAFLGLTVNCARCHDHKFDPISQQDYYRLSAALGGVRHGDRNAPPSTGADIVDRLAELDRDLAGLRADLAALDEPLRRTILAKRVASRPTIPAPTPIARWDFDGDAADRAGGLAGSLHGAAKLVDGRLQLGGGDAYASTSPGDRQLKAKTLEAWVSVDNLDQSGGGAISVQTLDGSVFDAIVYGERESRRWMPGSNGFVRTQNVGGPPEDRATDRLVHIAITYAEDQVVTVYRDGKLYGQPYVAGNLQTFDAGKWQVVFGLRHAPAGGNRLLSGSIDRAQLYDRALSGVEVAASAGVALDNVSDDELMAGLSGDARDHRARLLSEISRRVAQRRLLEGGVAYAVSPSPPEVCHILVRGDTRQPGPAVSAGGVASLLGPPSDFGLAPDAADADRRIRLAGWITDGANPLLARVAVNRVWHYHFGIGLVETPNDFGFNGGRPSHPELLDWLAADFVESGWSLKQLHRRLVGSATYRQASLHRPDAARVDAGNRLLWRKTPLRIEAEMARDAMLFVAGQLNPTMGGPGYQDFRTFTFNSQFYEIVDREEFAFQRRSIYRTWVRSGTNPLLDVLDCPDPSTTAPSRAVTTTPLQALALLNNSFVLRMSDRCAERLLAEAGDDVRGQIEGVFRRAFSRPPDESELTAASTFIETHGLAAFCRVVFNSNEFFYVD